MRHLHKVEIDSEMDQARGMLVIRTRATHIENHSWEAVYECWERLNRERSQDEFSLERKDYVKLSPRESGGRK